MWTFAWPLDKVGQAVPCCVWLDCSSRSVNTVALACTSTPQHTACSPRKRREGSGKARKGNSEKNGNGGRPKRRNVMANSDCYLCWIRKRLEYKMYVGESVRAFPEKSHWLRNIYPDLEWTGVSNCVKGGSQLSGRIPLSQSLGLLRCPGAAASCSCHNFLANIQCPLKCLQSKHLLS